MEGLDVSRTFWQGKRVFVTGHTGFKGSWLCRWLVRLGAQVTGYALEPATEPSLFEALRLDREMRSIHPADVRDAPRLRAELHARQPEIVFHLAAQALVVVSYERPLETYETNVTGTAALLDAIRGCSSVRAVVVVTSDKCYEPGDPARRHDEDDALGGRDPYSASKACAEMIVAGYRSSFFSSGSGPGGHVPAVATARAGNVIGGGDWSPHRLIPDAISAFTHEAPLCLRNPSAIRPWQHVLDPLHGYLRLARALHARGLGYARAWNFGPPATHEISVEELVREFAGSWGGKAAWLADPSAQGYEETPALRLNSARAETELQWQVRWPLGQASQATARWYRSYLSGASATALCDADLDAFEAHAP